MTNVEQGLWCLSKYRYSIKQLLALSESACASFDLSKFSFDAARGKSRPQGPTALPPTDYVTAGVVPPLGDCAANSRRSSAIRPRYPSGESVITVADPVMAVGTDSAMPERRPHPPPVSMLAQQHAGFARFLKKHTSPTHQRVTAGGRIVPMAPQNSPPKFALSSYQPIKANEAVQFNDCNRHHAREICHRLPMNANSAGMLQAEDVPFTKQSNGTCYETKMSDNHAWGSQVYGNSYPTTLQSSNIIPGNCSHVPGMDTTTACMSFMPNVAQAYNVWPTICAQSNGMMISPTSPWLYGDGLMTTGTPISPVAAGHLNQPIVWAQNAFSEWSQRYYELDQQLKTLDRHRAMTSLTTEIANQRREIVQQRSDSKNMMNLITAWLDLTEKVHPEVHPCSAGQSFNARAPAYVPGADYSLVLTSQDQIDKNVSECTIQKPPPRSARRPIPIVPPPMPQADTGSDTRHDRVLLGSPAQTGVDAWGVKLGSAPPELKKQQDEILESIGEPQFESPHSNQSQESLQSVPQGGFFQQEVDSNVCQDMKGQEYDRDNALSVESVLRLKGKEEMAAPEGLSEAFVNIDRNSSSLVNTTSLPEFEKDYWLYNSKLSSPATNDAGNVKPIVVRQEHKTNIDMRTTSESSSRHEENGNENLEEDKENVAAALMNHRKAATDAALGYSDENQLRQSIQPPRRQIIQDYNTLVRAVTRSDPSVREARPLQGRLGISTPIHQDSSLSKDFQSAVESRLLVDQHEFSVHQLHHGMTSSSSHDSTELFNNKGYSSIMVQNVNVVARLPQNLDGTTDAGKGSKSILALTGKIKSPRLLRRSVANGGAWYGPHCREVTERALICDDSTTRRTSPVRATR